MDFVSNQKEQIEEMLKTVGVSSVQDLLEGIPGELLLSAPEGDDGLSEFEGLRLMESLAAKNKLNSRDCYLGGGAYEHHTPAVALSMIGRGEFLTAYTPYQAEASQGTLQVTFEFQSDICALTGLPVANASVYDGASACAEGLLMTLRLQRKRNTVLIAGNVNPHYLEGVKQYLGSLKVEYQVIPIHEDGSLNRSSFKEMLSDDVAGVLLQCPNFFGQVEDIKSMTDEAKGQGALCVLSANPTFYGYFSSAAELGADIAVGDVQPFGIPLSFGGPYAGYMACRQELVRQMPARIVGETVDGNGERGFVLTLQAREQHIRREKATSNICTSQALMCLVAHITMSWYGKEGVRELSLSNYQRANYLRDGLMDCEGFKPLSNGPIYNEFVVKVKEPVEQVMEHFRKEEIEAGIPLGTYYPDRKDQILVTVTDTKSVSQLDRFLNIAGRLGS